MATTKIWKVQKRLDKVINYATNEEKTKNNYSEYGMDEFDSVRQVMTYATNPDKTEKQFYTTGINCEVKNSVKQMQLVKMIYGKENGILAFHAYQSFNEGEVTPEIAHEIGVKLANEMWGDRFQVVVSTHLNTEHLHNHFVCRNHRGFQSYCFFHFAIWSYNRHFNSHRAVQHGRHQIIH